MGVNVELIDSCGRVVATAQMVDHDGLFQGAVDLTNTPALVRRVFEEYEEIVENQIFSLLDEIEDKVGALGLAVRFEGQTVHAIEDLQIYPKTASVSFRAMTGSKS